MKLFIKRMKHLRQLRETKRENGLKTYGVYYVPATKSAYISSNYKK